MSETKQIRAVDMVRQIRDDLSGELAGKSEAEVIAFFKRAGDAAREAAKTCADVLNDHEDSPPRHRAAEKNDAGDPPAGPRGLRRSRGSPRGQSPR